MVFTRVRSYWVASLAQVIFVLTRIGKGWKFGNAKTGAWPVGVAIRSESRNGGIERFKHAHARGARLAAFTACGAR